LPIFCLQPLFAIAKANKINNLASSIEDSIIRLMSLYTVEVLAGGGLSK
jgi:hypothetical protein